MSLRRTLIVAEERWPLERPFTIARSTVDELAVVTVTISDATATGRGECRPYARYDETVASVIGEIEAQRAAIESGLESQELQSLMPAGAARNALDCALWDLAAKRSGTPVHALMGLPHPAPVTVSYTISLGMPDEMARAAHTAAAPLLKLKLGDAPQDAERLAAVRAAAPASRLIVDANEGWSLVDCRRLLPVLAEARVELVEQPLPADDDEGLRTVASPVPLCADESCHTASDLDRLAGLYHAVNIKLDKTGGPTGALALLRAAEDRGFTVMVGCMMATSLALAPAALLAGRASYVDLDAPLLLARDRKPALRYEGFTLYPPAAELWG